MTQCIQLIEELQRKSPWAKWLTDNRRPDGKQTRSFLLTCCQETGCPGKLLKRARSERSEKNLKAMVFELVAFELLRRLCLKPVFQPKVYGKTPDLSFRTGATDFLADVFVIFGSEENSTAFRADEVTECEDDDQAEVRMARKARDEIANKASKYRILKGPLVLFAFLFDHAHSNVALIENLLFSKTDNASDERAILMPWEDGNLHHRNLSAVVVAEWFQQPGAGNHLRRLYCGILHNPYAATRLPQAPFDGFQQVTWSTNLGGNPELSSTRPHAVSVYFGQGDTLEYS